MASAQSDVSRVPLQVVRGCLVASVQIELSDEVLHLFQQDVLERLRDSRASAVILDLSGVGVLDSSDFESVLRTLKMASLLGARPVIVGLRAGIAASLVELGISSGDLATCLSLERAFELVEARPHAATGKR